MHLIFLRLLRYDVFHLDFVAFRSKCLYLRLRIIVRANNESLRTSLGTRSLAEGSRHMSHL